jgi:hypothetical protein
MTDKPGTVNTLTNAQLDSLSTGASEALGRVLLELEEQHIRTVNWAIRLHAQARETKLMVTAMRRKTFLEAEYRWHEAEIAKVDR